MKRVALITLISLISSLGFAQEAKTPVISPVKKGKLVPYDGMLYNYEADSVMQEEIDSAAKICKIQNEYAIKIQQETCNTEKKQIQIQSESSLKTYKVELDSCFKDQKVLEEAIKKPLPPIILEDKSTRVWWVLLGVGAGAVITGTTTYLIMKFK